MILVIEDNEDNITLIAYMLSAGGHEHVLARSGAEGIDAAVEAKPDLVLLDIRMPEMDGYEVATVLKANPALAETRIVAVTASAMVTERERIAEAGFDGYIQKPINPETFLRQIEQWLPKADKP